MVFICTGISFSHRFLVCPYMEVCGKLDSRVHSMGSEE
jgi:hypothetical protein